MGQSFYGDIWKDFWLDDSGKEYDPEVVSKKVWDYLKTTGDVSKIDKALQSGKCPAQMRIVSLNPIVILVQPCQHKRFEHLKVHVSHGTKSAQELSFVPDRDMYFDEPMLWLSPDLKTGLTAITFSVAGTAEISLDKGKLKLVHEGDFCKVSRE